jgi:hypothetical protein
MAPGKAAMAAVSASLIEFPDEVEATSRTMFAPGAMAWAYSTSRLVSIVQPNTSCFGFTLILTIGHVVGSNGVGELPQNIVKDGGAGIPKRASNSARSAAIVGLPKASTITIVCPVPSRVAVDGNSYAFLMKLGE